jgi:UDP-glucuronate 4-epimerase
LKILVTGVAGFIGMHVANRLAERGDTVFGVDNLNEYYDVSLKNSRLDNLKKQAQFIFQKCDVGDYQELNDIFQQEMFDCVVHLAAQAGVRFSIVDPQAYINSNIQGFMNVLECCRNMNIGHLVYASSSSVYGENGQLPFNENHNVDHPVSLYAATKKANELMAHSYSHLYGIPTTGLRFFTVYGPWGRPDMAPMIFAKAILSDQKIDVFNSGQMSRDFTYIDDIVDGVLGVIDKPATSNADFDPLTPEPSSSQSPFKIFNIGNGNPTSLMSFIAVLENALGKKAQINMLAMQPGDVPATAADVLAIQQWSGFQPNIGIQDGVAKFAEWYLGYYNMYFKSSRG